MELVYLWVEEYKNIKNQGFNFSPRFEFHYDEDSKRLTKVKDERETFKNIFPENINITAIVGENGSGKSAILDILNSLIPPSNIIILYYSNNEIYYSGKVKPPKDFLSSKFIEIDKKFLLNRLFLSYDLLNYTSTDNYTSFFNKESKNYYTKILSTKKSKIIDLSKLKIKIFSLIKTNINKFNSGIFFYNPNTINISVNKISLEKTFSIFDNTDNRNNQVADDYIKKLWENSKNSEEKFYINLLTLCLNHSEIINEDVLTKLNIFEELHMHMYNDLEFEYADINNLSNHIENYAKNLFTSLDIKKCCNLFTDISNNKKSYDFTDKEIKNKNMIDLYKYDFINVDYIDNLNRSYNDLSLGERKIFTELLFIFDYCINTDSNDILLLLDEPDNMLHPSWQKKYMNELIKLLSKNFAYKKFHLVITSHSPFILSDIAKENIIFLEKYKENDDEVKNENQKAGNCKNVSKYINIKPFGANIHTLLSHGFFMEDGLMGEFAKEKITEIFNYLKDDIQLQTIEKKDVKNIIELIGEDFLREKLLHMYDIKFPKSNEERIKELEKEIERLKNA